MKRALLWDIFGFVALTVAVISDEVGWLAVGMCCFLRADILRLEVLK